VAVRIQFLQADVICETSFENACHKLKIVMTILCIVSCIKSYQHSTLKNCFQSFPLGAMDQSLSSWIKQDFE